jgi:hypothetical protein
LKNNTKMKIPKKYMPMIDELYKDGEGYWCYSKEGYYFEEMGQGCHTAHEDTQHEIYLVIRTLKPCECAECKEILEKR